MVPLLLLLPAKLPDCRHAVTDAVECRQVTAKGSPDVALSWIFDLQLGMARLFGHSGVFWGSKIWQVFFGVA